MSDDEGNVDFYTLNTVRVGNLMYLKIHQTKYFNINSEFCLTDGAENKNVEQKKTPGPEKTCEFDL